MQDLAIGFTIGILLLGTGVNLFYLMPVPLALKQKVYKLGNSRFRDCTGIAIALFFLYTYNYLTTEFHFEHLKNPAEELDARARIWKLERNFHLSLFNLVTWITLIGIQKLFSRFNYFKDQREFAAHNN